MFMSIRQFIDQRVYPYFKVDEQYCRLCGKSLNVLEDIRDLALDGSLICRECQKQMTLVKKIFLIDGIEWHVLYEYNEFLERTFFRYKEQRDRMLAPVFLEPIKYTINRMRAFQVCGLCSDERHRYQRGFEPLIELFLAYGIFVASPLYKKKDHKQSCLSKNQREQIEKVIERKQMFPLSEKPILLVDDVCTTGASLQRGIDLLSPKKVFVVAAHPLWLLNVEPKIVEKKAFFW